MTEQYAIKIHGHSCLEFKYKDLLILFDPWLCGSAYWRSWWNFPEPSSLDKIKRNFSGCKQIYIFITHLHWDHFHGPTLRKLYKEFPKLKILISRLPEKRLKKDLISVLDHKVKIVEINHGTKFLINSEISVKPFLSGPFLTDSAILIQNKNDFILNLNDSKPQSLMINQIKSSIGDGNLKVLLKSHASANARICLKNRDGSKRHNNDKKKEVYSREFINMSLFFKPQLAIPFASNMCYLHKDTMQYNLHSNTSDLLYKYYLSKKYNSKLNIELALPGEKVDLETLKITTNEVARNQLFADREISLEKYRKKYINKLEKSEKVQIESKFSEKIIRNYFKYIFSNLPIFLRILSFGNVGFIEKNNNPEKNFFIVNLFKKKVHFNQSSLKKCHTVIHLRPGVLNSALSQRNLNSLGISKLLDILTKSPKNYNIFLALCIFAEIESSPFISIKQFLRFFSIWIRRWRELVDYLLITTNIKKII